MIRDTLRSMTKTRKGIYLFIVFTIPFYFLAFVTRGEVFKSLLFGCNTDTFADFIKPMFHWGGNPYLNGTGCNYPAMNVLLLAVFRRFIPQGIFDSISEGVELRSYQEFWLLFFLYNIFVFILISISISKLMKNDKKSFHALMFAMLISFPVLFAFDRGNIINLSFAFTIFFIAFRSDERNYLRELALISLAVAFSLKIYPAAFGLLLIKDKEWKATIRACVYGLILFLTPFLLYGKESIMVFIKNLVAFSENSIDNGYAYNFSFAGISKMFGKVIGHELNHAVIIMIIIIIVALCIVAFFNTHREWKRLLVLGSIMVIIPNPSSTYTLIFLIPALVCLADSLSEKEEAFCEYGLDIPIGLMFALMFIPIGLPVIDSLSAGNYIMSWSYVVYYFTFVCIVFMLALQGGLACKEVITRRNN